MPRHNPCLQGPGQRHIFQYTRGMAMAMVLRSSPSPSPSLLHCRYQAVHAALQGKAGVEPAAQMAALTALAAAGASLAVKVMKGRVCPPHTWAAFPCPCIARPRRPPVQLISSRLILWFPRFSALTPPPPPRLPGHLASQGPPVHEHAFSVLQRLCWGAEGCRHAMIWMPRPLSFCTGMTHAWVMLT